MSHSGLIFLFSLFYLDLWVLKKRNRTLFSTIFMVSPVILCGLIGMMIFFLLSLTDAIDAISFLALFGILPLYLIRRFRFNNMISSSSADVQESFSDMERHEKLQLLSNALGITMAWILSTLAMEGVADVFISEEIKSAEFIKLLLSSTFSSLLLFWMIFKTMNRQGPGHFKTNLGLNQPQWSWGKNIIVPIIVGLGFACLSSWLVEIRPIQPDTPLSDLMATIDSSWMVIFFLCLAILIAPFVEELVFRGYFFYVLKTVQGQIFAIIAVSSLFAFLHVGQYWGDWLAIVMVALLGFVLTLLRVWAGSTWASIIAHYVYNAAVTFIPVVVLVVSNPSYFEYQVYYEHLDAATKETLLLDSIEKNPALADAYNDLASIYADKYRNLDQALELADKALSFDHNNVNYLDTKIFVLERMEKYEEAQRVRKIADKMRKTKY